MPEYLPKAILVAVIIVLISWFTYKGLNKDTAVFNPKTDQSAVSVAPVNFESLKTKYLGAVKTKQGFPVTYAEITATNASTINDIPGKINALLEKREYGYAALLAEIQAESQLSDTVFTNTGRMFINAAANTDNEELQLFFARRAEANLEKAKKINPESIAPNTDLAWVYLNDAAAASNPAEAMRPIVLLLEVVKKDPDNIEANYLLAINAERTGQNEKAIERYKKLISLQPQNPEYLQAISELYKKMGKTKEADDYNKRFLEINKTKINLIK
ncbi:MAG: tetratricopeptide repeat protein [Bacteroidia bacterium]|nr:tetratricopeptide repeat protein [Bacteroidia bacterium]